MKVDGEEAIVRSSDIALGKGRAACERIGSDALINGGTVSKIPETIESEVGT